ncbi:hypothetical protein BO70DRAFT_32649 [Aspergillus heteromorphus CBS 117.55]|uniref:Uncharacterized protein n=1 Tax=Aspergillus heteromorphus CBS 117.55 TaxID=1448321 RepID=A0A317W8K3_9EURO|nr:uncharacterized protein BO70DRAFT_32649 [Aspergillus heteromorphus CBS 117.55]PWY82956.1 hypothetical protein BO70DRAFT_32649 [Aspergillus heteromorphus CBS 117.55]
MGVLRPSTVVASGARSRVFSLPLLLSPSLSLFLSSPPSHWQDPLLLQTTPFLSKTPRHPDITPISRARPISLASGALIRDQGLLVRQLTAARIAAVPSNTCPTPVACSLLDGKPIIPHAPSIPSVADLRILVQSPGRPLSVFLLVFCFQFPVSQLRNVPLPFLTHGYFRVALPASHPAPTLSQICRVGNCQVRIAC